MKTVTFCGHGDLSTKDIPSIKEKLRIEIEKLIQEGASEFLLGGYGKFDYMSAEAVKELKVKYPYIKSILVIPYIDRDYDKSLYDYSLYPPIENVPKRFAISKRNEYMVLSADAVIAYVEYGFGGAAKTMKFAMRKKKSIINIADL